MKHTLIYLFCIDLLFLSGNHAAHHHVSAVDKMDCTLHGLMLTLIVYLYICTSSTVSETTDAFHATKVRTYLIAHVIAYLYHMVC